MNVCKSAEKFIICCEYYDPDELQRNVEEIKSEKEERHIKKLTNESTSKFQWIFTDTKEVSSKEEIAKC